MTPCGKDGCQRKRYKPGYRCVEHHREYQKGKYQAKKIPDAERKTSRYVAKERPERLYKGNHHITNTTDAMTYLPSVFPLDDARHVYTPEVYCDQRETILDELSEKIATHLHTAIETSLTRTQRHYLEEVFYRGKSVNQSAIDTGRALFSAVAAIRGQKTLSGWSMGALDRLYLDLSEDETFMKLLSDKREISSGNEDILKKYTDLH